MNIHSIEEVNDFLAQVKKAKGAVILRSIYGDEYNLKSVLSSYIVLGKMIEDHHLDLELFCDHKEDEQLFFEYFNSHPESI